MAALLIPVDPWYAQDNSGEHAVWRALAEQLPEAVLCSGVDLLRDGEEGEIDLLVAWPGVAIAVIEVKGGHVRRRDGAWRRDQHPIEPVKQANRARHLLIDRLNQLGTRSVGRGSSPWWCWPTPTAPRPGPTAWVCSRTGCWPVTTSSPVRRAAVRPGWPSSMPDAGSRDRQHDGPVT